MANPFRNTGISLITALTVGFTAYSGKAAQAQTQIPIEILSEDEPDNAHIRSLRDSAAMVISHRTWKFLHNADIAQKGAPLARIKTDKDKNVYRYRHTDKHVSRVKTPVLKPGDKSISAVDVTDLLKTAKGKAYISYIDTDLKEYMIATKDLQDLNAYHDDTMHEMGAHNIRFYMGFSDDVNATYWNPENSKKMGLPKGTSIVTMTSGFFRKMNKTICKDILAHDGSHSLNYTIHEKTKELLAMEKLPEPAYNAYNQYLEYQCDSMALMMRAANGTLPEKNEDLGVPQMMSVVFQDIRESYENETRGLLNNRGAMAITKEKNARIKEKRTAYNEASSVKLNLSTDYPSPARRTFHQDVLLEYIKEIRRAGKETDVSRALHMLLPQRPAIDL